MRDFAENQDAIVATEIAQAMGMHPWEIASNPDRNAKFCRKPYIWCHTKRRGDYF